MIDMEKELNPDAEDQDTGTKETVEICDAIEEDTDDQNRPDAPDADEEVEIDEDTDDNTDNQDDSDADEEIEINEDTDDGTDADSKEPGDQDKKEKKRHFGKSDKKQDKMKEQLDELSDKVMRQMAEFDNYRKRTEKEKQQMFETGARTVIEKLLPVVDNFERGLAALKEGEERTPFEEGMLMTYKQLMAELEKLEVKPLDAVGKEFDPNLHNAVMHVDDEEVGENIVVEELQKGYTYRDTVVRHSMVKVAN